MHTAPDNGRPREPWHALLAPLPTGAVPRCGPVVASEIVASPLGASVAGWEQLVVDLSAGESGLRVVLVVLDAAGAPVSASDMVHYRERAPDDATQIVHTSESLGGRLERDGTFRGTKWSSVSVAAEGEDEPALVSVPSAPSPEEVERLRALVAEVVRRRPGARS